MSLLKAPSNLERRFKDMREAAQFSCVCYQCWKSCRYISPFLNCDHCKSLGLNLCHKKKPDVVKQYSFKYFYMSKLCWRITTLLFCDGLLRKET